MNQSLNVEITIPIPEDHVLINRVKYEELVASSLDGVFWSMNELEERTGKKHEWLKENILNHPKFSSVLDVRNGGPVFYPSRKGEKWTFLAKEMARFLEDNFHEIFS